MADDTKFRFGEERRSEGGREFWLPVLEHNQDPQSLTLIKVLSWTYGEKNLIITIPHAGAIGSDTTAAGDIYCESGNVIRTRIGTNEHPIKTYAKDAASDIIGHEVADRLGGEGLRPHIIECHVHRSKVECNRSLEEIAVEKRGEEAQEILELYNSWIKEAIGMCKSISEYVPGVLLLDLHGHGHSHDHIELGYRLTPHLLNQIADPSNEEMTWKSVMTSSARNEFTIRHLVRRKYGADKGEEAVLGEQSFAALLHKALSQVELLDGIQCIPSKDRPCPGKLGYYIGAHTVREHSKIPGVDCVQIELPLSVRTAEVERRDAIIQVLGNGLLEFYNCHYLPVEGVLPTFVEEDVDPEAIAAAAAGSGSASAPGPPPPPPCPPPPPPPPAVAKVEGDGISHMTMMAKSRMHAELVNKAQSMQMNRVDSPPEPKLILPDPELESTPSILDKIKNIEEKSDGHVPRPPVSETNFDTTDSPRQSRNLHNEPVNSAATLAPRTTLPAKPKLYNSIFAERTLSEKETLRRNFLFGTHMPNASKTPSPEPKPADEADAKPEPEKPAQVPRKSEPKEIVKKKSKCCCTLM